MTGRKIARKKPGKGVFRVQSSVFKTIFNVLKTASAGQKYFFDTLRAQNLRPFLQVAILALEDNSNGK